MKMVTKYKFKSLSLKYLKALLTEYYCDFRQKAQNEASLYHPI